MAKTLQEIRNRIKKLVEDVQSQPLSLERKEEIKQLIDSFDLKQIAVDNYLFEMNVHSDDYEVDHLDKEELIIILERKIADILYKDKDEKNTIIPSSFWAEFGFRRFSYSRLDYFTSEEKTFIEQELNKRIDEDKIIESLTDDDYAKLLLKYYEDIASI